MSTYNSNPNVQTLADALAMDPQLRQNAVSRYFEQASGQFNALQQFTSRFDPKSQGGGGPRSVFCEKTDLTKGGAQTVNFNVIGPPGGPGVQGDTELTGRTSTPLMGTYPVNVDWVRDAFELTADQIEMLAAGRSIEQTAIDLLSEKMGLVKQNHMLKRLIDGAQSNVLRPNNRTGVDGLLATDVLDLDLTMTARARLQTLGAKPLMRNTAKIGCPIDKYLIFGTDTAMLNIRNDSSFNTAISHADNRGAGQNALFTGEILSWQGNPFYEFPVTDQDWDDFKGGPLIQKAVLTSDPAFTLGPNTANTKLICNAENTLSRYFQWWEGYQFLYNRVEALPNLSGNEYYGWAINPDGSVVFFAYAGNHNGNQITVTKLLSPAATGALDATTVGELAVGNVALSGTTFPGGGTSSLPVTGPNGAWVYSNTIAPGAVCFQANAKGVPYSRSYVLGSMAGCYAHGRVRLSPIKQERDYDFVHGRGFQMIFGTGVCTNAQKRPVGYLLVEHAVEHPGYPLPSKV